MPFIGKSPTAGFASIVKDDLTPNGSTTAFTLSKQVANANDIAVFLGNVRQEPTDAYTVNGTTLTMSEAPASGLNFYVLHIAGTHESSVVPADNTISTAKIQASAVTSAKLASGAAVANVGTDGIGATQLNLADNYTFTGTHKTNNGFVLLASKSDSSAVNYNSNVDLVDFSSHTSDYRQFFYTIDFYPTSGGNYHLFQYFKHTNTTSLLSCRVVCNGWIDNNNQVTPNTGTSNYLRTWFTAAGPGIAGHISGYIFNGKRSDADYDCGAMGTTNYHYSGQGNVTATFSAMATGSSADGIGKIGLNLDAVGHSNDMLGKANCKVWGIC